jgi:hypothetical protein
MANPIRFDYLPARIKRLPLDPRGYPVPWFVHWQDGAPDFRIIGAGKMRDAIEQDLCWICGGKLLNVLAFTVGPMCVINMISGEPPAHLECAGFAAKSCPFLTRPLAKRNERDLPAAMVMHPSHVSDNPEACAIVRSHRSTPVQTDPADPGQLVFDMGNPTHVEWFAGGAKADRPTVLAALARGAERLKTVALTDHDPDEALRVLGHMYGNALRWAPVH